MRENEENAARVRMLTEEKSLNIQTMKELMKENEELESDIAELRVRIEQSVGEAPAPAEVPAPPPQPPQAPQPPAAKVREERGM